jgi:hypothetical protein
MVILHSQYISRKVVDRQTYYTRPFCDMYQENKWSNQLRLPSFRSDFNKWDICHSTSFTQTKWLSQIMVFRDVVVVPCNLVDNYQCFWGTGYFHLLLWRWRQQVSLMYLYQTASRLNPEDCNLNVFKYSDVLCLYLESQFLKPRNTALQVSRQYHML